MTADLIHVKNLQRKYIAKLRINYMIDMLCVHFNIAIFTNETLKYAFLLLRSRRILQTRLSGGRLPVQSLSGCPHSLRSAVGEGRSLPRPRDAEIPSQSAQANRLPVERAGTMRLSRWSQPDCRKMRNLLSGIFLEVTKGRQTITNYDRVLLNFYAANLEPVAWHRGRRL